MHPHLKVILLRLCGNPKLLYYASTTPSEHSTELCTHFQGRLTQTLQDTVNCTIPDRALHEALGAGIPNYAENTQLLYASSESLISDARDYRRLPVDLVAYSHLQGAPLTDRLRSQYSSGWLYFMHHGDLCHLSPTEFCIAFAARCDTLPHDIERLLPFLKCPCGVDLATTSSKLRHILGCERLSFTPTHRHDLLKNAMATVCREFGIPILLEPRIYVYENGLEQRPDLTVGMGSAMQPIATDFVVVKQSDYAHDTVGTTAARARPRLLHAPVVGTAPVDSRAACV